MTSQPTKTYYSSNETAVLIRKALKANFPGVKFSVRKSRASSVYVNWTDGPTMRQVQKVTHRYEGASFDPMIDLESYKDATEVTETGEVVKVHYGIKYVLHQRSLSEGLVRQRVAEFQKKMAGDYEVAIYPNGDGTAYWRTVWTAGLDQQDFHIYGTFLDRYVTSGSLDFEG